MYNLEDVDREMVECGMWNVVGNRGIYYTWLYACTELRSHSCYCTVIGPSSVASFLIDRLKIPFVIYIPVSTFV